MRIAIRLLSLFAAAAAFQACIFTPTENGAAGASEETGSIGIASADPEQGVPAPCCSPTTATPWPS